MRRRLCSALDALRPKDALRGKVDELALRQKGEGKLREFSVGDEVLVRGYGEEKWLFGEVTNRLGSNNYEVEVQGVRVHRHIIAT